ncbi:MAG: chitobiase/beta-hexosaminidase C-terminal domain-containing protein [Desulfuromonadales bacterium]|nr:chitobiase/beta-hexosaminidase C-terminal domain-containing protein [Desulfuromonadales bacterium]
MKERLWWLLGGFLFFLHLSTGAALAYTVSGTIQNGTGKSTQNDGTNRVYVVLMTPGQSNSTSFGTSISVPVGGTTPFTIQGVPNGTYQAAAFMDIDNSGTLHINDPANVSGSFTVNSGDAAAPQFALPAVTSSPTLPQGPDSVDVVTTSNGALVVWKGPKSPYGGGGPNAELADSYVLYWGTGSDPANDGTALGSKTVSASGGEYHVFISSLTPDATLHFAVKAINSGGSATTTSKAKVIAAQTGGATVTGRVYSAGITKSASTPLFIALQGNNGGFYIGGVAPTVGDAATWTISGVQPDTYSVYAILDLNNDGFSSQAGYATGPGMNGSGASPSFILLSGATTASAPDVTLTAPNSNTSVTTHNWNNSSYQLQFRIACGLKRPISVTVNSGPNLSSPIDLGLSLGSGKGAAFGENGGMLNFTTKPSVGDIYSVTVAYSDNTSETLTPKITGVVTALASPIFPLGNTTVINNTSLLAWQTPGTLPAGFYDFSLWMNTSSFPYNQIWSPSDKSNFPATQLSILYNSDNSASQQQLTSGSYNWSINLNDGFGNQGQSQGSFTPQAGGPTISNFSPASGASGASVTINGSGFNAVSNVSFGGVPATSFTVDSVTQISATVPSNAPVGPITVTAGGVTGASSTAFQATTTITGTLKNSTGGGSGVAIPNATVTLVNSNPVITATTNASGVFTITIPSGLPVSLKASASGYRDSYTSTLLFTAPFTAPSAHNMFSDANLTSLGLSVATKGLIASRVRNGDTDAQISGATVTATSFSHPATPYAVTYTSGGATTASDGKFYVPNVDEGDIVTVTASIPGYAAETRTYVTHTGAVSQTNVLAIPLPMVSASPSGGSILSNQQITLAVSNPVNGNAYSIYYTTDNSDPTTSNTVQTYTGPFFLNTGSATLKFYAVNTTHGVAGNVVITSYTVTPATYDLNVSISGGGTITNTNVSGPTFSCDTSNCSVQFNAGSPFTLTATPSASFLFNGWSGSGSASGCTGTGTCSFTLGSDATVNATFVSKPPIMVPGSPDNYYQSLIEPYGLALPGSSLTMEAQATTFNGDFSLNNTVSLILHGGYDAAFENHSGYSWLHGILTIVYGNLTIDNFIIQ